jgi:peptidoglycan biosynthesis protein MviN/MurJ (putative lipid II flippase)
MMVGFGTLGLNALLNLVLYHHMGIVGPALATLIVTLTTGILIMGLSAKALGAKLRQLFEWKFLFLFLIENLAAVFLLRQLRNWLQTLGWHYMAILLLVAGLYAGIFLLLYGKRLKQAVYELNHAEE